MQPWQGHADNAHEHACERAEKVVVVNTVRERDRLVEEGAFFFDKKKGGRGLCITRDVLPLNAESVALKSGDALRAQDFAEKQPDPDVRRAIDKTVEVSVWGGVCETNHPHIRDRC